MKTRQSNEDQLARFIETARALGAALLWSALACVALWCGPTRAQTVSAMQCYNVGDGTALAGPRRPCVPMPLRTATVVTGGTAVTAFAAGDIPQGAYIYNPPTATASLCISETGTAAAANDLYTKCIPIGGTLLIAGQYAPAVSVNASDSGHLFSGTGYR